ncbi:MAG: bifunctional riboflavin kinase/FAD synthetase [Chloroflexi bacterium]|nr:bifunctional riboflavin kinase/FAD synthetase [Chloroflexota bacterium]
MLCLQFGDQLPSGPPFVATIGNFDGIHRGHQMLIGQVVELARSRKWRSVVVTFWPHPRSVLPGQPFFGYLTTLEERQQLLGALGVDIVLTLPFTLEVAGLAPEAFMERLGQLAPLRMLIVGADFRFGHRRTGDVALLERLGSTYGFTVQRIERLSDADRDVSSNTLREWLIEGDVERVRQGLSRPYALSGVVVHGDHRGHSLGYPTANIVPPREKVVPRTGIYAAVALHQGIGSVAAVSIGRRPQFDGQDQRVEAYLLDFSGDLYGQQVELQFVKRLRDELRFPSVALLIDQIARDVEQVRLAVTADDLAYATRHSLLAR